MDETQLAELLGPSDTHALADKRVILTYKSGARFEFEKDRLVQVFNYKGKVELSRVEMLGEGLPKAKGATPAPRAPVAPTGKLPSVPQPSAPSEPGAAGFNSIRALSGQEGRTTFQSETEQATSAVAVAAQFFKQVYDPDLFDQEGNFTTSPTLVLACLLRVVLLVFALGYALGKSDREMPWGERFFLASSELLTRLLLSSVPPLVMGEALPFLACELIVAAVLVFLVKSRPEVRHFGLAMKIVLVTKLLVFAVSFALFILLVNLAR
jgi:hypothetical protein